MAAFLEEEKGSLFCAPCLTSSLSRRGFVSSLLGENEIGSNIPVVFLDEKMIKNEAEVEESEETNDAFEGLPGYAPPGVDVMLMAVPKAKVTPSRKKRRNQFKRVEFVKTRGSVRRVGNRCDRGITFVARRKTMRRKTSCIARRSEEVSELMRVYAWIGLYVAFDYIFSLVLFIFFFLVCFVLPIVDPLLSVAFARFVGRGPVGFPLRDPFFRGVSSVHSRLPSAVGVARLGLYSLRPTFDPFGGLGGGRGTVAATTGGAVFLPRVDPFSGI